MKHNRQKKIDSRNRKMKILMVNYEYPPLGGGGGVFCSQLAEEFAQQHDVTVLTSRFKDQEAYEIINGVEIYRVPVLMRNDPNAASLVSMLSFLPSSLLKGLGQLRNQSYDIVHSMFAIPSAPTGLMLARTFKAPHVLSLLGGDVYDPSKKLSPHDTPILHGIVKSMMDSSDHVVALSTDIRDRARRYYRPSREIDIVHLGIPEPRLKAKKRVVSGVSSDDIVLVTVGRLVRRKAVQELIQFVDAIKNPRLKLIVVGDGPERKSLESQANRLELQKKVIFTGFVSDEEKFQLLNISDCYVSTSQHEGFGIVFLEAMACGLPIVCYDKGGQVDFLTNGETGYVVGLGNSLGYQEKLTHLVEEASIRQSMGKHNRAYVAEQYFISTCADKYAAIYDRLMALKRGLS